MVTVSFTVGNSATHTNAATAEPLRAVPCELERLKEAVAEVGAMITNIGFCLGPVLTPEPPQANKDPNVAPVQLRGELADTIANVRADVLRHIERMQHLMRRLEI